MTDKPITAAELEEWQRKTDAASSMGEWRVFRAMGRNTFIERNSLKYESSCFNVGSENDARFIATAREAMPRLLAEVKSGWHLLAEVLAELDRLREYAEHRADCTLDQYRNEKAGEKLYPCSCGLGEI